MPDRLTTATEAALDALGEMEDAITHSADTPADWAAATAHVRYVLQRGGAILTRPVDALATGRIGDPAALQDIEDARQAVYSATQALRRAERSLNS